MPLFVRVRATKREKERGKRVEARGKYEPDVRGAEPASCVSDFNENPARLEPDKLSASDPSLEKNYSVGSELIAVFSVIF